MKKVILLLVLLSSVSAFSFSDTWAIGGAFNYGFTGSTQGAVLELKTPFLPLMFGIGFSGNQDNWSLSVTGDYWFFQKTLGGPVKIYIGIGGYVRINNYYDSTYFGVGARIPIGLQIFIIEPLEFFIEAVPNLGVDFRDTVYFPDFSFGASVGIRFWIK